MRALLALLLACLVPLMAEAQDVPVVAASPPRDVSVTVYRDPNRYRTTPINRASPNGFALVTETRIVRVPAGVSTIRFEGVSGGIIPVSAVVAGLPGGTVEKNRDAAVLSPAALVDGTLGRLVTLRRTNRTTGAVTEDDATIVSGAANGVVLRTSTGVEALRCSGLPETPIFRGVPAGLSAEPVLSVTTRSPRAATATVTLSYLASEFDWSASYVATVAPDGRTLDLFAWMTLANGNDQTIPDASVNAVAGRLSRRYVERVRVAAEGLQLRCYPLGTTTSDLEEDEAQDIVVTGARVMRMAAGVPPPPPPPPPPAPPPPPPPPEDLGDLKLYRVPHRTSVAANQQKQVALLQQARVPFERIHVVDLYQRAITNLAATVVLRMRNTEAGGLGIAFPSGTTALYQARSGTRLLIDTGYAADTAAGQKFEVTAGTSTQVTATQVIDRNKRARITVTNANAVAAVVEVKVGAAGLALLDPTAPLEQLDGVWTWRVTVSGNGTTELGYGYR